MANTEIIDIVELIHRDNTIKRNFVVIFSDTLLENEF